MERLLEMLMFIIIFPLSTFEPKDLSKNFLLHDTGKQKLFRKTTQGVRPMTPFGVTTPFAIKACYRYSSETVNHRDTKPSTMSTTTLGDS